MSTLSFSSQKTNNDLLKNMGSQLNSCSISMRPMVKSADADGKKCMQCKIHIVSYNTSQRAVFIVFILYLNTILMIVE